MRRGSDWVPLPRLTVGSSPHWTFTRAPHRHWASVSVGARLSQSEARKTSLPCCPSYSASATFTVFSSPRFLFSFLCGFPKRLAEGTWRSRREFAGLWVRQSWTRSPDDVVLGMYLRTGMSECPHPGVYATANNSHRFWSIYPEQGAYRAPQMHCPIYSSQGLCEIGSIVPTLWMRKPRLTEVKF